MVCLVRVGSATGGRSFPSPGGVLAAVTIPAAEIGGGFRVVTATIAGPPHTIGAAYAVVVSRTLRLGGPHLAGHDRIPDGIPPGRSS